MSGRKSRRRRPRSSSARLDAARTEEVEEAEEPSPRRGGPFGSALFGAGESPLPPVGRSLARGLLAIAVQPVLLVVAFALVAGTWLVLIGLGFQGAPSRLVDVLALPPISTYFDLGTGEGLYGIGPSFLVFVGVAVVVRAVAYSALAGMIVEAVEDGRVSRYGLLRAIGALPTVLTVQVLSFSLFVAANLVFPILGPGIGFLGFVAAQVGGLFLLGFASTAAIREGRPVMETIRRSGRAAMLPGGRHVLLSALYFILALPLLLGFAPGGTEITANPTFVTWLFVFFANVLHLAFMAAFAYRWVVAEPSVPEQPVPRRQPARAPSSRARGRR